MSGERTRAAEHEAAHAVVALALGLRVGAVRIRPDNSGVTEVELPKTDTRDGRLAAAAVAVAGDAWSTIPAASSYPYSDAHGCAADMRRLRGLVDRFDANEAYRRSRQALLDRVGEVRELAARLERDGVVDLSRGAAAGPARRGVALSPALAGARAEAHMARMLSEYGYEGASW